MSGCVVPLIQLYDNQYFTDFQEPCNWRQELTSLREQYMKQVDRKQVMVFKEFILNNASDTELKIRSSEDTKEEMIRLFGKDKS